MRTLFLTGILIVLSAWLAACGGTTRTGSLSTSDTLIPTIRATSAPAPTLPATSVRAPIPTTFNVTDPKSGGSSAASFETRTNEGGSVTVSVTPLNLEPGSPSEFEVAMNTHSVDLSNDMLDTVVVRDDAGKEYTPTAWEGPGAGGHHRSGILKFPALAANARAVTLIVKNVAGVPERLFKWDLVE